MKKGIKIYVGIIVGIILSILGLLWFIQGIGIIKLCPILCFANCECITEGSLSWTIIGAIVFIVGIIISYKNFKKKN